MLNAFANRENALELRIAAYQRQVQCPSTIFLHSIKTLLQEGNEGDSIQLRSFVFSNLDNLRKSADKTIADRWQKLLLSSDIDLPRYELEFSQIFSSGIRISKYAEKNLYSSGLQMGAEMGGYWLWPDPNERKDASSDNDTANYWPKSVAGKINLNIFGKTFDFLEIRSRFGNVDALFQTMFHEFMNTYFFSDSGLTAKQAIKLKEFSKDQPSIPENTENEDSAEINKIEQKV